VVRAAAEVAGAKVERLDPSTLMSAYQGESERALATAVRGAIEATGVTTLLFADEIDSFCRQRHGDESETSRRLKNQLLSLLDELAVPGAAHVVFVGATNYPDDLDGALLRRFSVTVTVPLPSVRERRDILRAHLGRRRHVVSSAALGRVADETVGCSGADLARIVAQASLPCLRELSTAAFVDATTGEPCRGGGDGAVSVHHRSIDQLVTRLPRPLDDEDLLDAATAFLASQRGTVVAQETRT
jgi:SpoVK/Ycf46/Vps4 family AAA+-type ATPase